MRFWNNIDLNGFQVLNSRLQNLGSDPGSPTTGQMWFNTAAGGDGQGRMKIKLSTRTIILDDQYVTGVTPGTALTNSGTSLAPVLNVQASSGSVPGTMSTSDFTKLGAATNSNTNSTIVMRDSSGNFSTNMISIVGTTTNATDVATKAYCDSLAAGFDPKASVRAATTGALPAVTYSNGTSGVGATLTETAAGPALPTIDGVTLIVGDRILVKNQASTLQNGIYTVTNLGSAGASFVLTRATDFNTASAGSGQISPGAFMFVEEGTTLATTQWVMNTANPLTIGTTGLAFTQFGAGSAYTAGSGLTGTTTFSVVVSNNTIEINSNALRIKSSATSGQALLSGGTGVEAAYGALNLAGGTSFVTGALPKVNGGFGADVSTGLTQNQVAATPNGSSGAVGFRALVSADLPNLDFSKITTGIVPVAQGGTGVTLAATGGTSQVLKQTTVGGNITVAQLAFTDLSGSASSAQMPAFTGDATTSAGSTASTVVSSTLSDSTTNTAPVVFSYIHNTSGTPAANYGLTNQWLMKDSTTVSTLAASQATTWVVATHGSTTARQIFNIYDTAAREAIRLEASGAAPMIGFLGAAASARLVSPDAGTALVTFGLASGTPTFAAANISGQLGLGSGGTGGTSASTARANLGATTKFASTIGDGSTTSIVVTHNLGTSDVNVMAYDLTNSNAVAIPDVQITSTNTVTLIFATAPSTNQFRVVIQG